MRKILCCAGAIIIVSVLFFSFSTQLFVKMDLQEGEDIAQRVEPIDVIEPGDRNHYGISFIQDSGLFHKITISGFSFIRTTEPVEDKKVVLYFKNVDRDIWYMLPTSLEGRSDLTVLPDDLLPSSMGFYHGFTVTFSPLVMKDGLYQLFIYDEENHDTYGVIETTEVYEKRGYAFVLTGDTF